MALIAAALLMRVWVPVGFMPVLGPDGALRLALCTGYGPAPVMAATTAAMPHAMAHAPHGMHDAPHAAHARDRDADKTGAQPPCAFADLALMAIGGADAIQLAALLLFVLATGLATTPILAPRPPARLRPPLRAPPRFA